jgi:hypothetical protein
MTGDLHHPGHSTHSAHATHVRHAAAAAAALGLRLVSDHGFRGEEQSPNRRCVLQRGSNDLGRDADAGLDQVLVGLGGRVEAVGSLEALDLVDDDRSFDARVL